MTDRNESAPEETEEAHPPGPEETEAAESADPEAAEALDAAGPTDEEWSRRILCSDGNCIGVIGPDGRCKECGKPYEGELPADLGETEEAPEDESDEDGPTDGVFAAENDEAEQEAAESDDEWENRVLCSDGNCIGVIGPDGRCKECGKPYEGE
jgi:hypothetical protein